MSDELVRALCSCVGDEKKGKTRRFLRGLSADELQYIADFLGAYILESDHRQGGTHGQWAEDIVTFELSRAASRAPRGWLREVALRDEEHKMIVLLEYIQRCGYEQSIDRAASA